MPDALALTGGCQCRAVRYTIRKPPLAMLRCHCTDCQAQSASAFGLSLYVPFDGVETAGDLHEITTTADSGGKLIRQFCPACGTRVFHIKTPDPAYLSIKAGSLDQGYGLVPIAELWTQSKLPWVSLVPDAIVHETQPANFDVIMRAWRQRRATLAYYDGEADAYAVWSRPDKPGTWLERFAAMIPTGGHVLDLGCGGGWAAAWFRDQGYDVTAIDGSAGLAAAARRDYGLDVRVARFEDLSDEAVYDGVWAHFSLLHAPRADLPGHLSRVSRALKPGGALLLGLKGGKDDEATDALGRFYSYYSCESIETFLRDAGFSSINVTEKTGLPGYDGSLETSLFITARNGQGSA